MCARCEDVFTSEIFQLRHSIRCKRLFLCSDCHSQFEKKQSLREHCLKSGHTYHFLSPK